MQSLADLIHTRPMFSLLFKAFKTLGSTGGDLANYLSVSPDQCLPPITDEILLLPTHELAARIRRREITSEQVVRAFVNRSRIVNVDLNAVIDERYSEAIEEAKAIDEFLKTTTLTESELEQQKPFLGLPFTAKDSIQIAGMKWTSGCYRRKDIVATEDAPIIKNYRKAGAIPIALTNVPELLLWFASSNKLYGATNNPFDLSRTPGGSSGGEAALMSACGSPLSICSDIGGSIRMPAFHCGLFGHKPTSKVINWHGTFPEIDNGLEELFSFGPLTRYADDIIPALRVLAGDNFKLFRDIEKPVELKKLRIFYMDDAGDEMATQVEPYIQEAIREAANYFGQTYNVSVERANFKYFRYVTLWFTVLFSNNQEVSKLITENTYKINPFLELAKSAIGQSDYSPSALAVAAAQTASQVTCNTDNAPHVYERAYETLERARKEFIQLLGDDGVFLYVCLPRTAGTHYGSMFDFTNLCCPMVMNYLGAPVTQVPIGTNEGLPYGFQVAASPSHDRLTIAVAKELEKVYGGWIKPCNVLLGPQQLTSPVSDCETASTLNQTTSSSSSSSNTTTSSQPSTNTSFEQVDSRLESTLNSTTEPLEVRPLQESTCT